MPLSPQKNFMSDLKTLAKGLDAFSDPNIKPKEKTSTPSQAPAFNNSFQMPHPLEPEKKQKPQAPVPQETSLNLDQFSFEALTQVRKRFNLSSKQ